jgi:hypothetical protein
LRYGWAEALSRTGQFYSAIIGQFYPGVDKGEEKAFEALCDHLFENWIERIHKGELIYSAVVNGSGGDGGVEAYARLTGDRIIGLQAKWFTGPLDNAKLLKIKKSICTAKKIRNELIKYLICIPRNLSSVRITKGGKKAKKSEEDRWLELKKRD